MSAHPRWGRFTIDGSHEVEERARLAVEAVAGTVRDAVAPGQLRALVLLGGYGRGEGGVELRDGREVPHNNLDFLLITDGGDADAVQRRLAPRLQEIAREHGVGVDLGASPAASLRRAPCRVMWYDMRHGHKTVLGDAGFVPSLARFTVGRILPSDIRDLLTNRGTLLVINDLLLERGAPALDERKLIVRHGMKAVIGYGDALLFFLGDYHWSYAEKARRMARRTDVEPDFCDAYRRAIEFRFRPSYAAYVDRDLGDWVATMKRALAAVHLAVEARRLRRALPGWDVYQDAALRHAIVEDLPAWRAAAKKACYAVAGGSGAPGLSLAARLGLRMAGPRGVLPILFPAVAYPEADGRSRDRARAILRAPSSHAASLRRAYLRAWSVDGDVNFSGQLARYAIDLRDPPA